MKLKAIHIIYLLTGLLFLSCTKDDGVEPIQPLNADLDHVLFIGDDLTAGYRNFGWTKEKQETAFPVLFLKHIGQFNEIRVNAPYLPDAASTGGWSLDGFNQKACQGSLNYPVFKNSEWNTSSLNKVFQNEPFNVIGIPRLTLASAVQTDFYYKNLFFRRLISPNSPNANVYNLLGFSKPDLFVLHLGQGDIMRYALNGGVDAQGLPIELMSNLDFGIMSS